MARTILKGAGKLLGVGGKKKAETPAATPAPTGPIVKLLGAPEVTARPRRGRGPAGETILSDKLGA
jgi:hypothetical protein